MLYNHFIQTKKEEIKLKYYTKTHEEKYKKAQRKLKRGESL